MINLSKLNCFNKKNEIIVKFYNFYIFLILKWLGKKNIMQLAYIKFT